MKLYSLDGPSVVEDPEFGTFTTNPDDGDAIVGLPDALYDRLHRTHIAGKKVWENEEERDARLVHEEDVRRRDPATLLAAVERMGAPRELTAQELREAHEERKRIRDEEEQRELDRIADREQAEAANAAAVAKAEQERIDELPVKVGDTVKLTDSDAVTAVLTGSPDHPEGQPASDWRGLVTDVVSEQDGDTRTDVASFEGQTIRFAISILTVVDVEAERAAAEKAEADAKALREKAEQDEADRIKAEADAEAAKKNAPAGDGTAAPKAPAKSAKPTASK